jgi:hypothetical protein
MGLEGSEIAKDLMKIEHSYLWERNLGSGGSST